MLYRRNYKPYDEYLKSTGLGTESDPYVIATSLTDSSGNDMTLEPNGSVPVTLQDQDSPIVITKFTNLEQSTTTSAAASIEDYSITVTSPTGIAANKIITIFDPVGIRFSQFICIGITGSVVQLDTPLDFAYPSGSYVDVGNANMAVDGSVTPVVFGIRNNTGAVPPPGISLTVDITRIIFSCAADSAVNLNEFANITKLTRGLVLRKRDGTYYNIFNVKTNKGFAGIMYDFTIYEASNPVHAVDGFVGRLTFSGQDKMGAVLRLPINEDLEIIVQDDLTDIVSLNIIAEGSVVR